MKRVLALLSLVCALALASACHSDVNLSVDASAELTYANGDVIRIDPVLYEGFHHSRLTDNDLEDIFIDLTKHASLDFMTAVLHLEIYDVFSGKHLRDETYGVVYNAHTGHYDFADMDIIY
jgi:hypothetical protein